MHRLVVDAPCLRSLSTIMHMHSLDCQLNNPAFLLKWLILPRIKTIQNKIVSVIQSVSQWVSLSFGVIYFSLSFIQSVCQSICQPVSQSVSQSGMISCGMNALIISVDADCKGCQSITTSQRLLLCTMLQEQLRRKSSLHWRIHLDSLLWKTANHKWTTEESRKENQQTHHLNQFSFLRACNVAQFTWVKFYMHVICTIK